MKEIKIVKLGYKEMKKHNTEYSWRIAGAEGAHYYMMLLSILYVQKVLPIYVYI